MVMMLCSLHMIVYFVNAAMIYDFEYNGAMIISR